MSEAESRDQGQIRCEAGHVLSPESFEWHRQRVKDLSDALGPLVRHYRRHTTHRCEILLNAEAVLRGERSMNIEDDGDIF